MTDVSGVSDKGRFMIEHLYIFKCYGAKKLIQEFPNKRWGLNKFLKKKLREKLVRRQNNAAALNHKLRERTTTLTLSCFYIL